MKRYEAYKPSGTAWFTSVPEPWNILKINALFSQRKEKVSDKDFAPISVTKNGIMPQLETAAKTDDGDNRKKVCVGDFVINSRSDRKGSCGVSSFDGSVSLINIVLQPRQELNGRYAHYLLRSQPFSEEFYRNGRGIVADLWTTRYSEMKNILLPVPPRDEQDQIVRYLDWQVSKINRLIAAKRKQIELLNQTIAYNLERIICEGIHGEELVETGNPWISTAPKSWNKLRHKNILTEKKIVVGDTYSQYTLLSLTTKGIIVRDISSGKGKFPSDFSTYQVVQPSDMVFCLFDVDETPRTVGLSAYTGMITGAYTVYETHDVLPEFLLHYFTAIDNKKGFKPLYSGLRKVIGKDVFSRQSIYLPSVKEQKEIVAAIDASQKKCKKAMDLFEQEIIALTDLRTHLISDVVIGQIDVRGIEVPTFEYIDESNNNDENTEEMEAELDG